MRISDWSSDVCSSDRHKRYTSQRHNRFHSLFQISPGQAEMVFSDTMTRATRNKLRAFVTAAAVAAVCLNQTSATSSTPTSSADPEAPVIHIDGKEKQRPELEKLLERGKTAGLTDLGAVQNWLDSQSEGPTVQSSSAPVLDDLEVATLTDLLVEIGQASW